MRLLAFLPSAQEVQAELTFTVSLILPIAVASQGQIAAAETPGKGVCSSSLRSPGCLQMQLGGVEGAKELLLQTM